MAIRTVLKMGDPRLFEIAQPVTEFNTPGLAELLRDMHDTMEALDGAGLAAPQIGVGLQVVIFGVTHNPRYPDAEAVPHTVLINPVLTVLTVLLNSELPPCCTPPATACEVSVGTAVPTFRLAAMLSVAMMLGAERPRVRLVVSCAVIAASSS